MSYEASGAFTLEHEKWLAGPEEVREWMQVPQQFEGHVVCTNGHVLLVVNGKGAQKTCPAGIYSEFSKYVREALCEDRVFRDLELPRPPKPQDCWVCNGSGLLHNKCDECSGDGFVEFENSFNLYEFHCKSCAGAGRGAPTKDQCKNCHGRGKQFDFNQNELLSGVKLQWKYLSLLYGQPGIRVAFLDMKDTGAMVFRQEVRGNRVASGILVGMRRD